MTKIGIISCLGLMGILVTSSPQVQAQSPASCDLVHINFTASRPLGEVSVPPTGACNVRMSNGFPIPDPTCTLGAINPEVTVEVLNGPNFRTKCERDQTTSLHEKNATYDWHQIPHPAHNTGANQTCELDHLISLELGGADTLDNLWPECGPDGVALAERFFKQKDIVENYLAAEVKACRMDLAKVQKGIATDWTQYLDDAKAKCPGGNCP